MSYAIAIDGPAGAGKSSVAKQAARELGFVYVDTGAMYRAIALYMLQNGIEPSDSAAVQAVLPQVMVTISYIQGVQCVFLCGQDVSQQIRTQPVSMAASAVSAIPAVRQHLLALQLELAQKNNVIMDGRDIGTVVLPQAQVKIFLTACAQERAKRRYAELCQKGQTPDFAKLLQEIEQRDRQDSTRAVAPLKPAQDAVMLDTTSINLDQAVQAVVHIVRSKLPQL